ncbi:MAG: pilus assembly protein [Deltaproteobacteria bacterium]|nr:pilus assembly protein [Deltaproteobacteria bacterium]
MAFAMKIRGCLKPIPKGGEVLSRRLPFMIAILLFPQLVYAESDSLAQVQPLPEGTKSTDLSNFGALDSLGSRVSEGVPFILLAAGLLVIFLIAGNAVRRYRQVQRELKVSSNPGFSSDERGQAMTEFVLIFPTLLLMTLLIMQMCLIKTSRMLVSYAAFCATRSLIVWLPYESEDEPDMIANLIQNTPEDRKMDHVRRAAWLALIPAGSKAYNPLENLTIDIEIPNSGPLSLEFEVPWFASTNDEFLVKTLSSIVSIVDAAYVDIVPGILKRFAYVASMSQITLMDANGAARNILTITDRDPVGVNVGFLYRLSIPMADRILGSGFDADWVTKLGYTQYIDIPGGDDEKEKENFKINYRYISGSNSYYYMSQSAMLVAESKFNHPDNYW